MDKLEKVLAAEEAARHTVADARERAERIRTDGRAHARDMAARIVEEATEAAAADRERVVGEATQAAAALTARAETDRQAALERAGGRIGTAVEAVVRALRD